MLSLTQRTLALLATLGMLHVGSALAAGKDGAAVYKSKCLMCHGKDGVPKPGFAKRGVKSLADAEWQKATSDDDIRKVILEGSKGTLMRAYKNELSDEDVEALIKHLRDLGES